MRGDNKKKKLQRNLPIVEHKSSYWCYVTVCVKMNHFVLDNWQIFGEVYSSKISIQNQFRFPTVHRIIDLFFFFFYLNSMLCHSEMFCFLQRTWNWLYSPSISACIPIQHLILPGAVMNTCRSSDNCPPENSVHFCHHDHNIVILF